MIKRILVGLGGTPYTQAEVRHAVALAREHQASITAVTVVDLARISNVGPAPIGGSGWAADLVQHRLAITQQAADEAEAAMRSACEAEDVRCHIIRDVGDPFEDLLSIWRYHDLTILALRSLFEYGVVHDPIDMLVQMIARGVRPILAVARDYRPIKRALIAYNGSMESAKAMKQFAQMRLWPQAQVRIAAFDMREDQAKPLLHDAREYCEAHGFSVDTAIHVDDAQQGLLDQAAAWQADMIVMGSTARARIFKHLLGDTALYAVKHAEIPLFMSQ